MGAALLPVDRPGYEAASAEVMDTLRRGRPPPDAAVQDRPVGWPTCTRSSGHATALAGLDDTRPIRLLGVEMVPPAGGY